MKDFLKMVFASLTAVILIVLVIAVAAGIQASKKPEIESHSWLVIDIYGDILAYNPPDDLMAEIFGGDYETLNRILENLDKAVIDDRIEGVLLKVSASNSLGSASYQEIRGKIKNLQAAGKKVYAFSDNMNRSTLYLASACDSIFVPMGSDMVFKGVGITFMYMRGLLDKLDINPNIHRIAEYKSAAEPVLRKDMSPESREMYGWMLDELWDMQMSAVAEDRGLSMDQLTGLMERALFTAPDAKEAGLVDDIMYWSDLLDMLKQDEEESVNTVSSGKYADIEPASLGLEGDKKIAVIHAQGAIGGRSSRVDPMWGMVMGHETVSRELRRARKDEDIAAVVFRIDSGGGESLASDLIKHEVERLAAEKPVVTSMIDVAASGGYSIAYTATKLMADPMTITGSIGSINGKMNVAGMYNKIGLTFDRVAKGPNPFLWSEFSDFTDKQRELVEANHWKGFYIWLEDVSEKRGIELDRLKELAMGRVWTGRQAVENGLIDELGGLEKAIAAAKDLAGIPEDEQVTIVHYPEKKGLLDMIAGGGGGKVALRWVLYKFIREDLAASMRMATEQAYVPMPTP
jgi:protease-4